MMKGGHPEWFFRDRDSNSFSSLGDSQSVTKSPQIPMPSRSQWLRLYKIGYKTIPSAVLAR
jgi:hypothetical protein